MRRGNVGKSMCSLSYKTSWKKALCTLKMASLGMESTRQDKRGGKLIASFSSFSLDNFTTCLRVILPVGKYMCTGEWLTWTEKTCCVAVCDILENQTNIFNKIQNVILSGPQRTNGALRRKALVAHRKLQRKMQYFNNSAMIWNWRFNASYAQKQRL